MSTWLSSFSLPNPFKLDDDDDEDDDRDNTSPPNSSASPTAAVKHELSAFSQTFSHHLRGVADFLAPSPLTSYSAPFDRGSTVSTSIESESAAITGIKNDLVEIGDSVKSLLSSSSNKAVSGMSKLASSFLQFRDGVVDEEDDYQELEDVPGINEEIVEFVREVSSRPELWTDFPISIPSDFSMSQGQKEHAITIEQLVPSLASLRQKIRSHLSGGQFWMIYFILLLPRLNEIEMELLSTSEILHARETLLQNLQNKRKSQVETRDSETPNAAEVNPEINTKQVDSSSVQRDVSFEKETNEGKMQEIETGKLGGSSEKEVDPDKSASRWMHSKNVEDISFSDLEDEDNDLSDRLSAQRLEQSARVSSSSESNEWVGIQVSQAKAKAGLSTTRAKGSEGEEPNDWFKVDETDLDNLGDV